MMRPPDPETRRAASAKGSPNSQEKIHTEDSSLAAYDFQAHKLRRLFSLCQATACTVANLAWGVAR
jgi:hypothetical protein